MAIKLSLPDRSKFKPKIIVIGVGGAGGNAVNNMISSESINVDFLVANTDSQVLDLSLSQERLQLGAKITKGLGAGADPEVGKKAAEEDAEKITELLEGYNICFLTAGMGGGTGTGASPVIAAIAQELGVLTVGVVTKPFDFEGVKRRAIAEDGIRKLRDYVDTLIVVPNQNLFRIANERTTFAEAFAMADGVLCSGVKGITDLMLVPGLINLDFADLCTVMKGKGRAVMGTGYAEGANRATAAAEAAITNPILDDISLSGAKAIIVNITGGTDMTLFEVNEATFKIRNQADDEAEIIVGSTFNDAYKEKICVSIVATGLPEDQIHSVPANNLDQVTLQPNVQVVNGNGMQHEEDSVTEGGFTGMFRRLFGGGKKAKPKMKEKRNETKETKVSYLSPITKNE